MSKCDKQVVTVLLCIAGALFLVGGGSGFVIGHYAFPRRIFIDTERAPVKFKPMLGHSYQLRGLTQIMATEAFFPEPDLQPAIEFILREPDKMHEGWTMTQTVTVPVSDTKLVEGIDPGLIVFTTLHGRTVALYNLPAIGDTAAAADRVWTAINTAQRPDGTVVAATYK